ncbi:alcohol dehydrogenase GroES domain-containing protein [Jackrogersella minutella]|nr:alcohol dehydrogenase GroES domain-containing protein [Jackrogersella minutella]
MSSSNPPQLPDTYKALLFKSASTPPTIESFPSPKPEPGSVIVRPLFSWVFNYAADIFTKGNPRSYHVNFPIIGGGNAIGRVAAVSSDARSLQVGDLVTVDPIIKERDGAHLSNVRGLGFSDNGTWAELVQVPLENALRIDEVALKRNNIAIKDVGFYSQLVVAYGGLREVNLTAGETVLITPATGNFGGAAVHVALAMGARVVAMGRNEFILAGLKAVAPGRIDTIVLSGSVEADMAAIAKYGPIDVFQDFSPPMVENKSHIQAGILSVRINGRVSLMGNVKDLEIPYHAVVYRGLRIQGTLMYTRDQALDMLKLIETGTLKLGTKAGLECKGIFELEDKEAALDFAAKEAGAGSAVYFAPNKE